MSMHNLYWII